MIESPSKICAGAWVLGALTAGALLLKVSAGVDWSATSQAVTRVPVGIWLLAAAGWLGSFVIRAWRLQREWSDVRRLPMRACLQFVFLHAAGLMLMPLRVGEAGYVWRAHRGWGAGLGRAAGSLIWMRWQDVTVLACMATALLAPGSSTARAALAFLVAVLGAAVLPGLALRGASGRPTWHRWVEALQSHRVDLDGWAASVCNWLLRLFVVVLLLQAMTGIDGAHLARVAIGMELSHALPVQGIGGLGTFEAGAWLGAWMTGVEPRTVIGAALVVHAFVACVTLAGAAVLARLQVPVAPPAQAWSA